MGDYYTSRLKKVLNVMRDVYQQSIRSDAPRADAPPGALKVQLHGHQQAMIHRMAQQETELLAGKDCSDATTTIYANYSILADTVGSGKSLMILGHIARLDTLPPLQTYQTLLRGCSDHMFGITKKHYSDISEAGSLIVVPHTLFRQWAEYIRNQTALQTVYLDKVSAFTAPNFQTQIMAAKIVLISNTMYKHLYKWCYENEITWKRVFIDEADTIAIPGTQLPFKTRFTWLISASWPNLLFPNDYMSIYKDTLNTLVLDSSAPYSFLRSHFDNLASAGQNAYYSYLSYSVVSNPYFRGILDHGNPYRGRLVLRCDDAFIKESISLPPLYKQTIICKQPVIQQVVAKYVSNDVANLLHAGDISGAIAALGVKSETKLSLVDALTGSMKKELSRLEATYAFKEKLEYSSPSAKQSALAALDQKIKQLKESIESIKGRIEGADDMCPICYDDMHSALMTPCCSRTFCAQCILQCLTKQPSCPMCREPIVANKLIKIVGGKDENAIVPAGAGGPRPSELETIPKKPDALLHIFHSNPEGRFLVFSRYDNPLEEAEVRLTQMGIRVKMLRGNKDAIAATLRGFQAGQTRCLLLNSRYAGAGLNITAASHVILLHAMTHEEEKQILGRAYRLGRTEPLQLIKLLHEGEAAESG
jgi:hypothetical protein